MIAVSYMNFRIFVTTFLADLGSVGHCRLSVPIEWRASMQVRTFRGRPGALGFVRQWAQPPSCHLDSAC